MQTKEQKKKLVKELSQKLKDSKATVFSDFKGMNVKDMTILRRELKDNEVDFQVLKKTLLGVALKKASLEMDTKKLEGQIAIAISSRDEVEAAKIIAKNSKGKKNLKIVGGLLGLKVLSEEEVLVLSKLPGKEELLAKLVGTINAPVQGLVNVLAGNLRGLVQALKAISESKA
ncbi:MAG: 50S ribosomal protein L10 [Candidatus Moranbacteria bacterium CG_4_8_14_3_um_filter_34_16]|nr:MAG: 50S ribosomal protein L10 [Candidatus Moranbacteria bacterium CG08_land_8_20_14_0_20_34_16]PIW95355.1 MAG: 50S ribosomal protein L10 [Candidatus Moranbacteria bacterium CG_4_8_14_3_um_filter_34_16]PJA89385.1 MAG: 50S ribosomal protein L10 [Candidatus Moranbacteria bacterium CG_4_9_14_3_um_filter_33_15]